MRRIRRPLLALFLLLPSLSWSEGRAPQKAKRDAQAITVIAQSLSQMGLVASSTIETIGEGTMTYANGKSESIKLETIGTDRLRCDLGGNFTMVSKAGNGFVVIQGARHVLPAWTTKYKRPNHLPGLSLMADYQIENLQLQYVGLEKVNGTTAHHLRISVVPSDETPAEVEDVMSELHVYVDQASLMVIRIRTFDFSPETPVNRTPVDTDFGDYRQQDGALIPFRMTRYVDGQKESVIVLDKISLNASVSDSDFE